MKAGKRILSLLLTVCVLAVSVILTAPEAQAATRTLESGGTSIPKMTQEQIASAIEAAPLTMPKDVFVTTPSYTAPHTPGKISDAALNAALDRLNLLRRLAGLPAVALDSALSENAQYGAVLLASTNQFGHHPTKPADMADEFFSAGYTATSSSNLAGGRTLTGSVDAFMDDSDSGNISALGHRRWQLNPTMGKTGFGYAYNSSSRYRHYVTEKCFDESGEGCDYEFVGWPASGNFPSSMFESHVAWSVTLNPDKYTRPSISDVRIRLTRESDGAVWEFSGDKTYSTAYGAQYFNVETSGYGVANCIIFRPDGISSYDGKYTVEVSGITDRSGAAADFSYQVDFFSLKPAITSAMFTVDTSSEVYTGKAIEKEVKPGIGYNLVRNVDYTVSYSNNTNAGTATVTVSGMGEYSGTLTYDFIIEKAVPTGTPAYTPITADGKTLADAKLTVGSITPKEGTIAWDDGDGTAVTADTKYGWTFTPADTDNYEILTGKIAPFSTICAKDESCPIHPYKDTNKSSWYHDGVHYVLEKGYMNGTGTSSFAPNSTVNRAMIVTILYRLEGSPAVNTANTFTDVKNGKWYTDAVKWAAANGIVNGYGNNKFAPEDPITREQLAVMLCRYAEYKGMQVSAGAALSSYTDSGKIGNFALPSMRWAVGKELINGKENNRLDPKGSTRRSEAATVIMRFCENVLS